jgi:hypothetical protein
MLDVRETAPLHLTRALASKVRALEGMPLRTPITLFAVAEPGKRLAYRRIFVDVNMGIPAIILVAVLVLEMNAVRRSVGGRLVRERT